MNEHDAMERVKRFVDAENAACSGGRLIAETIISTEFTQITRAGKPIKGRQEETREGLLATIEAAAPNSPRRAVEFDGAPSAWPVGPGCWIVKGVVITHNENDQVVGRFRNTWIFRREEHEWRLFSLQVTRLVD